MVVEGEGSCRPQRALPFLHSHKWLFLRNQYRSAKTAGPREGLRSCEMWWSKVRGVAGLSEPCHFCTPISGCF